jgi:hypothetical protein
VYKYGEMMGSKKKLGAKLLGGAAKFVAGAAKSTPIGAVASSIFGGAKAVMGGSKGGTVRRRKRGITYYLRKIPVEKAKARLQKIKMSAYKGL